MKTKKSVVAPLLAIAAVGLAAGFSSLAEAALTIRSPSVGSGNLALLAVGQRVEIDSSTTVGNDAELISASTGSTQVSVQLVEGNSAQVFGFNASRVSIAGCSATDSSTGGGAVVDACVGVAFKQVIVTDNSP